MKIIRVFPRRTKATPMDKNSYVGMPTLFCKADEIHISVTFTWDLPEAERLAEEWKRIAPVKIGGPAIGMAGEDFVPGEYIKQGYVITSRGCPNKCWFCSVPKREGNIRELPIRDGYKILDDNLLACSNNHISNVFEMLKGQKGIEFTGGLEAKRLKGWHVKELKKLRVSQIFFAYDTEDDLEPLIQAGKIFQREGFNLKGRKLRCYNLIGWPKDTFEEAEKRMRQSWKAGFFPMAMLWRDQSGETTYNWRIFQRLWARPAATYRLLQA